LGWEGQGNKPRLLLEGEGNNTSSSWEGKGINQGSSLEKEGNYPGSSWEGKTIITQALHQIEVI
jgi:hypothetical protein